MTASAPLTGAIEFTDTSCPDAGIFTWDLARNLLFGDAALAELHGLSTEEVKQGLPIARYIGRVHQDDRIRLVRSITHALIADRQQQETYRVQNVSGEFVLVESYGRAFCDSERSPILFSGIIVPAVDTLTTVRH